MRSSSVLETVSKSDHMLCNKTRLNKSKKNEITQRVFPAMVEQNTSIKERLGTSQVNTTEEENTKIIRKYLEKKRKTQNTTQKDSGHSKQGTSRQLCSVNVSAKKKKGGVSNQYADLPSSKQNKLKANRIKEIIKLRAELIEKEEAKRAAQCVLKYRQYSSNRYWTRKKEKTQATQAGMEAHYQNP